MISDYFKLAVRNMRKRKLRSLLTMLGIIISIATIFVLVSVSLGLEAAVQEQFRQLGTDKFFIQPRGQFAGPGSSTATTLTPDDLETIKKVPGVHDAFSFSAQPAKIEFGNQVRFVNVYGVETGPGLKIFQEAGFIRPEEGVVLDRKSSGEIMIGSQYKHNNIFRSPVLLGSKLSINDQPFKVKGILRAVGNPQDDRAIYLTLEDFESLFPERRDVYDQLLVQISPEEDVREVASRVERRLMNARDVTEETRDFTILTPEELLESFSNVLNIITAFLAGVAAISLLVGGIGIANTMYTSVLERTREIGVMKATGAKNKDVLSLFLVESGLLGLIGGIVGVALGFAVANAIEYIAVKQLGTTLLQTVTPIPLFLVCLLFAFAAGAVSGILPAWRASKLKTVDALRYE